MAIEGIYANVSCTDLAGSEAWYRVLFGREPDTRPMQGLVEWHFGAHGFQLFEGPEKAGKGALTLVVGGLTSERERIAALSPGEIEPAMHVRILRLDDPDGNLVVLAGKP